MHTTKAMKSRIIWAVAQYEVSARVMCYVRSTQDTIKIIRANEAFVMRTSALVCDTTRSQSCTSAQRTSNAPWNCLFSTWFYLFISYIDDISIRFVSAQCIGKSLRKSGCIRIIPVSSSYNSRRRAHSLLLILEHSRTYLLCI